jgi:ankyrin repeat protein
MLSFSICKMAVALCVGDGEFDSQNGSRSTALMLAAHNGRADCVRLLIDAGADKNARNNVRGGRCFVKVQSILFFHFGCFHVFIYFDFSLSQSFHKFDITHLCN